jgi:hypothetical protein
MIDFSKVTGISDDYGVITQITDASGRVLWALAEDDKPVVLGVKKITSDTYAGETTYTGEEFILLDIYPKTNGTVSVTYGGLTKTITDTSGAEEPNAQRVFFGTFNGVSDSVTTPASGELTIEGDYYAVGQGAWKTSSKAVALFAYQPCVTKIESLGTTKKIPAGAFYGCALLTSVNIPHSVTVIGASAFYGCTGLESVKIYNGLTGIHSDAFRYCTGLKSFKIPASLSAVEGYNPFDSNRNNFVEVDSGNTTFKIDGNCLIEIATNKVISGFLDSIVPSYVTQIGAYAFAECEGLTSVTIPSNLTTISDAAFMGCTGLNAIIIPASVTDIRTNAFRRCSGLTSIRVLAATPPLLGNYVFSADITTSTDNIPSCNITVPKGCGATYKAAEGWSTYANYIVEAS